MPKKKDDPLAQIKEDMEKLPSAPLGLSPLESNMQWAYTPLNTFTIQTPLDKAMTYLLGEIRTTAKPETMTSSVEVLTPDGLRVTVNLTIIKEQE